jgi:hypothetical protein
MTAPGRDRRPPSRWLTRPALRLHAALVAGLALAGAATWLEWTRARSGHPVAWVYTFEWPLFAVLGMYLWWRLLPWREAAEPTRPATPERDAADDEELRAWQAYLDRLHAADPPGGPPAQRSSWSSASIATQQNSADK